MPKCPNCGNDAKSIGDSKYVCPECGATFSFEVPNAENDELAQLKARIAALEAEKQAPAVQTRTAKKEKSAPSPALVWLKKYWAIPVIILLVLISAITLMTCLIGLRGVYYNVQNPNEFYSFTATSYEHRYVYGGKEEIEKGSWHLSDGKLYLEYKDTSLGIAIDATDDLFFEKSKGYDAILLGDKSNNMTEFKRASIVTYSVLATKATVTFDMNMGTYESTNSKVKQGGLLKAPNTPTHPDGYEFKGWYDTPYGYKHGGKQFNENCRVWENATYYANWDNPTEYNFYYGHSGEPIKEGDSLLATLNGIVGKSEYIHFDFYLEDPIYNNDKLIDENTYFTPSNNPQTVYSVLTSIDDGITEIPEFAFRGCRFPESLTIPDSVTSLAPYAFYGCGVTSINIPNSVTSIGEAAFGECNSLTSITIPNSVARISRRMFEYCYSLTNITIPDSVTSIGKDAFLHCNALTSITIPNSVTSIEDSAFGDCSSLTNITIPDNVPNIGSSEFNKCSGLISVTIPNSVTIIGYLAFGDCSELTDITFKGTKAQWTAIFKSDSWNYNTGNYTIHCTDGNLDKNGNEI